MTPSYSLSINTAVTVYSDPSAVYSAILRALSDDFSARIILTSNDGRGQLWTSKDGEKSLREVYSGEIATLCSLSVSETFESGHHGDPLYAEKTITGFSSWEQAERIASQYGLQLVWLRCRDGWKCPERYCAAADPIDVTENPEELGYAFATCENVEDFRTSELEIVNPDDFDSEAEMNDYISRIEAIAEVVSRRKDHEVVLYDIDSGTAEISPLYVISYHADVWQFTLGAVVL